MAQTKKKKTAVKAKPAKKPAAKKTAPVKKAVAKPAPKMNKSSFSASPAKKPASSPKALPSSFQPLDDRIIVSVEPASERTAGGIIIPGSVAERPFRGKVLAKGPGHRNKKGLLRPLEVSVGDMVLFSQFAGQKIEIDANEFLILREEDILAISIA